ncbi:TPA: HEAT repeat domain-containing protein [Escherichia coli]
MSDIGCLEIQGASLAAIYALGEGRCQAENITRELHRLSQSDDMEIKIAAIKALGRIYR